MRQGVNPFCRKESGEPHQEGSPIKVQVFVIKPSKSNAFDELTPRLQEDPEADVVLCSNALECVSPVQAAMASLVVAYGEASDEILSMLTAFKLIQREIRSGSARIALLTPIHQTSLLSKFNFLGVTEVIPDPTPARSLLFKVQRHLKALSSRLAEAERAQGGRSGIGIGGQAGAESADRANRPPLPSRRSAAPVAEPRKFEVHFRPPLEVDGDFWFLSGQRVRRAGGKWIVRLKGPNPGIGQWEPTRGFKDRWIWRLHEPHDPDFSGLKGNWVFHGQKPDFEDGLWRFIGARPQMDYEVAGEAVGHRIIQGSGERLLIAKDSELGAAFLPKIDRSVRREAKAAAGTRGIGKAIEFERAPPLSLKSDCWLLEKHAVRRVNQQWIVKLTGPGPAAGRWAPAQDAPAVEGVEAWKFEAAGERGRALTGAGEPGDWVFYGRKPRFEGDGWVFVSPQPLLGFFQGGSSLGNRIEWNEDDTIALASDSPQAEAKLPQIRQTWQDELSSAGGQEGREIRDLRRADGTGDGEGSDWVKPALSPLGLAFLAAELAARKGAQSAPVAERWMGYLSSACGDACVELWLVNNGQADLWLTAGSGRDESRARWVRSFAGQFKRDAGRGEAMVPVKSEAGDWIGILVLAGPQVAKIADSYLLALEWSARGLLSADLPFNRAA